MIPLEETTITPLTSPRYVASCSQPRAVLSPALVMRVYAYMDSDVRMLPKVGLLATMCGLGIGPSFAKLLKEPLSTCQELVAFEPNDIRSAHWPYSSNSAEHIAASSRQRPWSRAAPVSVLPLRLFHEALSSSRDDIIPHLPYCQLEANLEQSLVLCSAYNFGTPDLWNYLSADSKRRQTRKVSRQRRAYRAK